MGQFQAIISLLNSLDWKGGKARGDNPSSTKFVHVKQLTWLHIEGI